MAMQTVGPTKGATPRLFFEMVPDPASLQSAFSTAADILSTVVERDVGAEFGDQVAALIRERTRGGHTGTQGRTGQKLKNYSEDYARRKGVAVTAVDYTLSGQLLDAMVGAKEGADIVVRFEGPHNPATAFWTPGKLLSGGGMSNEMLAIWLQKRDPFFGLTGEEEDFVVDAMRRIVETTTTPKIQAAIAGAR